jgi:methyltransferase (TIGR00027 family)
LTFDVNRATTEQIERHSFPEGVGIMRNDNDSWDLRTGVGVTATMVAAARAVASRHPNPVINDPFAEIFVRAVGIQLFTQIVDGLVDFSEIGAGWVPALFGIRGWAFDDFVTAACRSGIRQTVILAAGLDCRALRLDWPPGMAIYEIDQPAVIDWKKGVLANLGWASAVRHHYVGIDLRQDWPTALRQAGFDTAMPTAWLAEGLLIGYLPPTAQDELLKTITALSAASSLIAADHFDARKPEALSETLSNLHDMWHKHDPTLNLRSLTFSGSRHDPAQYLAKRGWITRNRDLPDLFRAANRPAPAAADLPAAAMSFRFLSGIRN